MMTKLTAAQQRYLENATLIAATRLIFKGLEASGIPLVRLDEIADTTSGGTPERGNSRYYEGDIPWIKSGELEDAVIDHAEEFITEEGLRNSSAKIFPKGTLLVALYGATVGKTGVLAIDAATNQAICAVMPKSNNVTTTYLHWFMRHKRPDFLGDSFGGAQPNISQKMLRETSLPLPSIEMQREVSDFLQAIESRKQGKEVSIPALPPILADVPRLVARIEALAAKIEEARGLRRRSMEEATKILSSARRGFIGQEPTDSWVPLRTYVREIENGRSPDCEKRPATNDEWGVLKVGAISFGVFDPTENKALPLSMEPRPEYEVHAGDFLMSRANTFELVGACVLVEHTRPRLMLSSQ